MNITDKYLTDHTTPERRDMLIGAYDLLVSLGHVDHELNIENLVSLHGSVETISILMLIESEIIAACHNLMYSYHIVCRRETTVLPYLGLLTFLNYIENTIESETVLYYYNDELTPVDQLLSWVEVFREDLLVDIGSLILDVTPSLIENILQTHELKSDVEITEYDAAFHSKIRLVKLLREHCPYDILPIALIKEQKLKTLVKVEEIPKRYGKWLYMADSENPEVTPFNIIAFLMLTTNDIPSLKADVITLVNALYDDVKKTTQIMRRVDEILNPSGELCKIMNTI